MSFQPAVRALRLRAAVVLAGLAAGLAAAPAEAQYDAEVARFKVQDRLDPVPPGGIVFTGSSSVRRYEQLQLDFHDYHVVQRGLGGATFPDLDKYLDDVVLAYRPAAVVVWCGTNDLAAGATGPEVVDRYQRFVARIHAAQPTVEIFYIGIMPTPGRRGNRPREDLANSAIARLAAGDARQHYIDMPAAFAALDPYEGEAFTSRFADDIHLNRAGYDLWRTVIRPQLAAIVAPNKVYAVNPLAPKVGDRLLFDFGPTNVEDGDATPSPDANGNHWNNPFDVSGGTGLIAGEHHARLVTAKGADAGVTLTLTAGFKVNGKRNGGLTDPKPALLGDLAVATATDDYLFSTADGKPGGGSDDDGGGFMLSGLDPALAYDFAFFGSRDDPEARVTEYLVTGTNARKATLQTSGKGIGSDGASDANDDKVARVRGVRPDGFGQLFVDMTLLEGSYAYLNAMEVTVVSE